ncbi:MAG: alpha/beta hydrolase [Actinobacteria bacterium]|nr:alpha/beta hydrolase [Actinomycetota bacterium]
MAGTEPAGAGHDGAPATVVLVHGAWHGAWCWERVVDGLRARGTDARAVDLPGHGEDAGPAGDLHADAARVRQMIDAVAGPVLLVGHSYGGAVITEAGEHPAVAHLVYLCAIAPDAGETCTTAVTGIAGGAGIVDDGRPNLASGILPGTDGTMTVEPSVAAACLYNDCDPESTAWAVARLGPQPIVTLQQDPHAVAWRTRPSTYVVCTEDLAIPPELQRVLAQRCTETVEWNAGHSPFLSQPHVVTELLDDLARRAGPGA